MDGSVRTSQGDGSSVGLVLTRHISRSCRRLGLIAVVLLAGLGGSAGEALAGPPLLPNLVADPPDNISQETSVTEGEAKLLLRFNGYIHNKGPGAVDFRGSRVAPKLSPEVEAKVKHAEEKKEPLPQSIEEELAASPMKVVQRLFTTKPGVEETNTEREHVDEPSEAKIIFASADGHHHWHLQQAAKYSLWNAGKTAEVAPAQKVGFCLDDSEEQHVEKAIGPPVPVYSDKTGREFCRQWHPNATSLFEGISPGWRDLYSHELAFQWVDASDVAPGEYWLREDVNPIGAIKEGTTSHTPTYAVEPTIVKGFDALPQSTATQAENPQALTLTSKAWNDPSTPKYTIVSPPQHGKLGPVVNNQVTYTPQAGYTGPDSFSFSAADPSSPFPRSAQVATVSIEVRGLLVGDGTSSYGVPDQTAVGREEAFQFTAKATGTVGELQFRTNGTANPGVMEVAMAVFADNAGKPGEVLGVAIAPGEPATNSWIRATGLSTNLVQGVKYWLVVLPLGKGSSSLHFNAASKNGGTGNVESLASGLTEVMAEPTWEAFNQGPVGFEGLEATPTVSINGAQAEMIAGTSVTLAAAVSNDSGGVEWSASAGSLTAEGPEKSRYQAPAEPPPGGVVTVTARLKDDPLISAQQAIRIIPVPTPQAAPEVPGAGTAAFKVANPALLRPRAVLIGRKLVMSTIASVAGRVRLSAYLHKRRLGTCAAETPANRVFTCRLTLGRGISLRARISVLASLRVGSLLVKSALAAERIPQMRMRPARARGHAASAAGEPEFWCSPQPTLAEGL
jgi:hypothetical protein